MKHTPHHPSADPCRGQLRTGSPAERLHQGGIHCRIQRIYVRRLVPHLIRLLTLAVVSCALAALLSGCTKEEFIAGYNEFMFGDWFPTYGSTSQSGTSYDPDHVYDPPNPECDAKISSLLSQLYSLESSARSAVSSAISAAKDEYHSLPAEERTFANKVSIAYKHLSSVESTYDSAVSSVVSEMRRVLREYNQPETVADQAWSYYQSAKSSMISSLGG